MRPVRLLAICALSAVMATPALADFEPITDEAEFTRLIRDNRLTRLGIDLTVTPDGRIDGKAFGRPVTGNWAWQGGYFCRDLVWGERDFGYNCQEVARNGDALRFTSDRGRGQSAELTLR